MGHRTRSAICTYLKRKTSKRQRETLSEAPITSTWMDLFLSAASKERTFKLLIAEDETMTLQSLVCGARLFLVIQENIPHYTIIINPVPRAISQKENIIARLELEFAYFLSTDKRFSDYATGTLPLLLRDFILF